jgi:hypothetical protein
MQRMADGSLRGLIAIDSYQPLPLTKRLVWVPNRTPGIW